MNESKTATAETLSKAAICLLKNRRSPAVAGEEPRIVGICTKDIACQLGDGVTLENHPNVQELDSGMVVIWDQPYLKNAT